MSPASPGVDFARRGVFPVARGVDPPSRGVFPTAAGIDAESLGRLPGVSGADFAAHGINPMRADRLRRKVVCAHLLAYRFR